jgi:hypothetical protein
MKKIYFFLSFLTSFSLLSVYAETGDTTTVKSHGHVNMVWNGAYDQWAEFPSGETEYSKILMKYTLGCASGGCSDWDYDVNVYIRNRPGYKDSSVASLDTISQNPLVVDTTWNVYDAVEQYEMGRFITPYGSYMNHRNPSFRRAGFDSAWEHTWYYDVTDYYSLLKDSTQIRSHYRGWSSGFSATIEFIFIEGQRDRDVLSIQNIYTRGGGYNSNFETNVVPAKTLQVPEGAESARAKVLVTGHGADQSNGCAEFCQRSYAFKANEETIDEVLMWRDDCGINALKPQGGTWIFDRGNWCPGDLVFPFFHDLSPYLNNEEIEVDMDILSQNGFGGSYNLFATAFFYGPVKRTTDVAITDIISPSTRDAYQHWNPICGEPKIVIANRGAEDLTFARITYGIEGYEKRHFEWEGSLPYGASDTVVLPNLNYDGKMTTPGRFKATVEFPNRKQKDEQGHNNTLYSTFEPPESLPAQFKMNLRTNGRPEENRLTLTNLGSGETLYTWENLTANTTFEQEVILPVGCYEILLEDAGKDGLSFWYYAQTNQRDRTGGNFYLSQPNGLPLNQYQINRFNGDFGTEIRYQFVIGNYPAPTSNQIQELPLFVAPNPANDAVQVSIPMSEAADVTYRLLDLLGHEVILETTIPDSSGLYYNGQLNYEVDLSGVQNGMYILDVSVNGNKQQQKLIIEK